MEAQPQTVHLSDGCAIRAKLLGDEPGKPLMIAHHGAPGLSTHLEAEAAYGDFADKFRVLVFDMRGCGDSDKQRPYTHAQWTHDIDELRQWAGAEKCVMIGASHGGFLTLEYALTYQQHLYGIIVGDSAAQVSHWGAINMTKAALTDPRVKPDPEQLVRMLSGNCRDQDDLMTGFATIAPLYAAPDAIKDLAEIDAGAVISKSIKPFYETVNAAMNDCASRYDVRDRLHEIKVPAFVFVGRHDWITPVPCSEFIAEKIPTSKLVIYQTSGHFAALEQKTPFQRDVREFIKTLGIPEFKA
ncbi:hypothetical protein LTR85_006961 [Meristemomyces frigidus]|nr:hypothetical protein LTR85_006961 [Meristemomyces frigidus]